MVTPGDRTLVTGWGETHGSGNFRYLREVEVPIRSNDQCRLKGIDLTSTLCAGLCTNSTCDACQVKFKNQIKLNFPKYLFFA